MYDITMLTSDDVNGRPFCAGSDVDPRRQRLVGTSFKHEHLATILADSWTDAFFEVHAENYMGAGGPPHRILTAIREQYPLSIHGVCMSIGGSEPLNTVHLERFAQLVKRYEPALVSEHLAWSSHNNTFYNDLLPLPYTHTTLQTVCDHIDQVQTAIARPLLLENPSTYIQFASSDMQETDFLHEIAHRTGCGLLLDINNVYVSAINHEFSAEAYLADFPLNRVGEIHLAGHSEENANTTQPLLIDSHDRAVAAVVWRLYESVIDRAGPIPTLIEWDSNVPAWPTLKEQALCARQYLDAAVSRQGQNVLAEACHDL